MSDKPACPHETYYHYEPGYEVSSKVLVECNGTPYTHPPGCGFVVEVGSGVSAADLSAYGITNTEMDNFHRQHMAYAVKRQDPFYPCSSCGMSAWDCEQSATHSSADACCEHCANEISLHVQPEDDEPQGATA